LPALSVRVLFVQAHANEAFALEYAVNLDQVENVFEELQKVVEANSKNGVYRLCFRIVL
jgi:hypothetical protein